MTTFSINPEFDCPASELTEQVVIKWFCPIMNSDSIVGENWLIRSFAHVKFLAEPEQTEELFRLFDATKVVFRCNPNLRQLSQQADDATVAAMAAIERFYWQKHGEFFNAIITHYVVTAEDYEREVRQPLEHACQSINVFCKAFCEVCKKTLARKFDAKVWEIYPGRLSAEDLLPVVERRTLSPDGVASLWFEQVLDQQSAFKAVFQPDAEELDFIRTEQIIEDDQGRPCYSNEPFDSIASHRLLQKSWECQDFCVWGGYSRGSPTRLPFVFEMQYARPDAIAGAKVEGPARSAGGSSLAPAIARREAAGALAREV